VVDGIQLRQRWPARSVIVRRASWALAICVAVVSMSHGALGAVKSVSTDGEATIYATGEFSKAFDVAYRAVLKPGSHNTSWSTLSILLIGSRIPGPGASVGVATDASHPGAVTPFTYVAYPNLQTDYEGYKADCRRGCVIELRGDSHSIYAEVDGKILAEWSRSDLYMMSPSIQLNAEAHGGGDVLYASLTPVRSDVAAHPLRQPTCAFSTRGIEPSGLKSFTFRGRTNSAGGAFVNLSTGTRGDKC
jgi:hypothetical protein